MSIKRTHQFHHRHIGPQQDDIDFMLQELGYKDLDEITKAIVPTTIADNLPLALNEALTEEQALKELHTIAKQNKIFTSLIGQGYYGTY
ncbi:MAG: glycine dehydrogenase, partial [Kiritimatiellia bacterium]